MTKNILTEHINYSGYNELAPITSMTAFMKKVSRDMLKPQKKKYKFTGNRAMAKIAKGVTVRGTPSYYQLSIVKSRIVKSKAWHSKQQKVHAVSEHISYLQREEVAINNKEPCLFNSISDDVDGREFAKQIAEDRHHFRFIISPENGQASDLKFHAREVINDMETDLGLKLKWLGVIHKNTDNPHIHIVIRGVDNKGKDLIIKPDYITRGIRARSSESLTFELGPRNILDVFKARRKSLVQNRPIALDYKINEIAAKHKFMFTPALFVDLAMRKEANIRLKHLQSLGLVSQYKSFYKVATNLIDKLKDLEAQQDIYKRIARFGIDEARQYMVSHGTMVGKVLHKGLKDELAGTYYLIVNGADGNKWYVDLSNYKNIDNLEPNQIVTFEAKKSIKKDPLNLQDKVYFSNKVICEKLTSVEQMVSAKDVTLLDKYLVKPAMQQQLAHTGFGANIRQVLEQRKQVLVDRGLGQFQNNTFVPVKGLLKTLDASKVIEIK